MLLSPNASLVGGGEKVLCPWHRHHPESGKRQTADSFIEQWEELVTLCGHPSLARQSGSLAAPVARPSGRLLVGSSLGLIGLIFLHIHPFLFITWALSRSQSSLLTSLVDSASGGLSNWTMPVLG